MKKGIFLMVILMAIICSSCKHEIGIEKTLTNEEKAECLIDSIFACVAWVEDDKGEQVYWCGARWTGPYGITVDENGHLFHKGDIVSKPRAKKIAYQHLRERVFPFLKYVERELEDCEIIATCMFIYNVGGEQFSGYRLDGVKARNKDGEVIPPSHFLEAINAGEEPEQVVNYLTGFKKSGGKLAKGLLKRHWVTGAVYLGCIRVEEVMQMRPRAFYDTNNFGNYYWLNNRRNFVCEDGYYKLRYDDITIPVFHRMNDAKPGQRTVASIM